LTNSSSAVLIGSQRPSLCHLPSDRRGNAGREAVELAAAAGLHLDDWQAWCLDQSLAEQSDNQWSAFEVCILVGRQNGKGSILEARQLAGLTILHERLQVHTAHEFRTCFEHFIRMVQLVESCPEVDAQVMRIRRGAGEQSIEMRGGERLRFLARSGGSGRGMSGDCVYLDEAFALHPPMMGALLPTLSARPNPQMWYTSSAPMSTSDVLHGVRARAVDGSSARLFFAEWGNEPGVDPEDRDAWARANPALGIRIAPESIAAELDAMRATPGEFIRERLGVPDPLPTETVERDVKLPADKWAATVRRTWPKPELGAVRIGWDVAPDGSWASIVIALGTLTDPYVEQIEHRQGVGWLPGRLVDLATRWKPPTGGIACDGVGAASAQFAMVREAFEAAGLDVDILKLLTTSEYRQACGAFYTDVIEGRLRRPSTDQGPLDVAAGDASERPLGDAWAWDRRRATVPISPLIAATIARSLLTAEVVSVAGVINLADYLDLED